MKSSYRTRTYSTQRRYKEETQLSNNPKLKATGAAAVSSVASQQEGSLFESPGRFAGVSSLQHVGLNAHSFSVWRKQLGGFFYCPKVSARCLLMLFLLLF